MAFKRKKAAVSLDLEKVYAKHMGEVQRETRQSQLCLLISGADLMFACQHT